MVVTSIVQSSTAVTAMTVAMGISHTITIEGAIGVILGANIGSCITGLIASLRLSSRGARQASIAQITMNVFGVLIFLPFIAQYARIVCLMPSNLPRQIANAHTIFNITVSFILFPFVKPLARLTKWLVPDKLEETPKLTAYIDEMQQSVPAVALTEAARELVRVGEMTAQMLENSRKALFSRDATCAEWTLTQEDTFVDPVCKEVEEFINTLMRGSLSMPQQRRCFQLKTF